MHKFTHTNGTVLNVTEKPSALFRLVYSLYPYKKVELIRLLWIQYQVSAWYYGTYHIGIRTVSPEPSLFARMKYGSRWMLRPKIRHLAPLDSCTCAFEELVYGGRKSAIISWAGSNEGLILQMFVISMTWWLEAHWTQKSGFIPSMY